MARKSDRLNLRLPPSVMRPIRAYARQADRPLTWVITRVLRHGWPLFVADQGMRDQIGERK